MPLRAATCCCHRRRHAAYYRGAMGILMVYDVTDEASFNNIRNWMKNIEQHASDSVVKVLVGNKCDMDESKRAVPYSRGQVRRGPWVGVVVTQVAVRGKERRKGQSVQAQAPRVSHSQEYLVLTSGVRSTSPPSTHGC